MNIPTIVLMVIALTTVTHTIIIIIERIIISTTVIIIIEGDAKEDILVMSLRTTTPIAALKTMIPIE